MRLKTIKIQNFRSIKECVIQVETICALVGENNSGKSAILRALNAFFNFDMEKAPFEKGDHQYSATSKARIELTFTDVPDKAEYVDKLVSDELTVRMIYTYQKKKRTLQFKKGKYRDVSLDFLNTLLQDINYILIPPVRELSRNEWTENNLIRKVLDVYFRKYTQQRDVLSPKVIQIKHMEKVFEKLGNKLKDFYSLNHNLKFRLAYEHKVDYSLLLNEIFLKVNDHDKEFAISQCGSGIQSLTAIALYRFYAHLEHNNTIIGIEEPETNLHPQAQRELIKHIKSRTHNSEAQVVFTTHSAVIVDQLEHDEIVLFRKVADESRRFKSVTYQIPPDFWEQYELEKFKYYQFYRYKNSEFFFAKYVLIVESKTDAEVIRKYLVANSMDPGICNISILNLDGVDNLKYPYFLLKHLGIPCVVIVDKDFFLPYSQGELSSSRSESGFPKYRYEYKDVALVSHLITKRKDRDELLVLFRTNHKKVLDLLEGYRIICFRYSLEADLISCSTPRKQFYEVFGVPEDKQNTRELLVNRKKQIKKPEHLLAVIEGVRYKNLPHSYVRVRKVVSALLSECYDQLL